MRVELTADAAEQLRKLPRTIRVRVTLIFGRLEKWPAVSGAKSLSGPLAGRYRIRTGGWRVQFYLKAQTIVVEKLGHRDGFYEE
jgi:mRNA-degrading endonuclease RelE of RelBE toxin-antitoxin system